MENEMKEKLKEKFNYVLENIESVPGGIKDFYEELEQWELNIREEM